MQPAQHNTRGGSEQLTSKKREHEQLSMASLSEVQVVDAFLVAPSEATPRRGLWLSPLDLDCVQNGYTPTVYFYRRRPGHDAAADFFDLARLKAAMAKALVHFYPLAGRLGVDKDGRIEICCNGEGALFVVARSDELAVDDFVDVKTSSELKRLFVPCVEPPSMMMAIQVTFLKCGGVALGTALHHAAIDGLSAFHFFQAWSAFSRDGANASVDLPFHDRTLLRPRSPPVVDPAAASVFCSKLDFSGSPEPTATEVFTVSRQQVASLKRLCGGASSFATLSALVWQCACAARRLPPDAQARVSFPANVRRSTSPPLPDRYFGNAFINLVATAAAWELAAEDLASVAGRIRGVIKRMDDEVVRSAIDYIELADVDGRPPSGILPETELRVISWLGMPLYDADFGWGKPSVFTRAEWVRGGYVYLMNDGPPVVDGGSGDVLVVVSMEAANMKAFEQLLYAKL
ncbi:hypothetical protein BS78_05G075600 [Paspalum vaginatum]|nr:hypothetical protein BS78_05G075600 [Paspalum vaginatum]